MKPYVFITRKLPDEAVERLRAKYDVKMWEKEDVGVPRSLLLEEAERADALLTMLSDQIDEELLSVGTRLKVVANLAVGYDNVNVEAATKRGVAICNTPDVLTDATADLTFALLMATARRIVEGAEFIKAGQWKSWSPLLLAGHDIHHKTIGIVGMGSIGSAVAKRATGFEMEILYHNRSRKSDVEKELGATYCSFEQLIERSDFVVCLTPLTEETKNLFTRDVFRRMKKSAIFINASRGPVVNEEDLYAALMDGDIAAAGLDVFAKEPIDQTHPLLTLSNVVAIPHIGSATVETRLNMIHLCLDNIDAILSGQAPKTLVNNEWNK
ncbi:D-glycerate dehydrogenase [Robertmurraya sp. DFI.2.37]|uniref:2-hydroxyacid dehydrogenase n=1 Tax=Robertmurraya sp. DFI.2.37 TaxID=3031819 RepID=UPI0023DAD7B0|nr:D-glycerate dehydrogenase [Robertmurraya sp. DFI.2.37]MDF1510176.1 D-glycerate dehydrogenase [Robertmurraya sp. DFI.2.37]